VQTFFHPKLSTASFVFQSQDVSRRHINGSILKKIVLKKIVLKKTFEKATLLGDDDAHHTTG
jgi:hypothetical protein